MVTIPKDILILDTETTGGGFGDEVLELAVINFKSEKVLFDSTFYPEVKINRFAEDVHNLSIFNLIDSPYFKDKHYEIFEILNNKPIVSYNANFDKRLLLQTCRRYDKLFVNSQWICLMDICTSVFGTKHSLSAISGMLDIASPKHRALSDCQAKYSVLKYLLNNGFIGYDC